MLSPSRSGSDVHPAALSELGERRLVAALVFASLAVSVQSTLGAPLIPTIARDEGVSLQAAQWILTITLLVSVLATPTLGRLGDGPRRRRVLLASLLVTSLGCVIAATAHSFEQLLLGRACQGVGYGIVPLGIALAREHLTGPRMRRGVTLLSISVAVGAGLGYPVTGFIGEHWGAGAAFWFGAVVSFAATATVAWVVPRPRGTPPRPARFDVLGAALAGGGLALLLFAVSRGPVWGWGSAWTAALALAACVILVAFVAVELRREHPLIDVRLMAQRTALAANVASVLLAVAMYGALSLVSLLVQTPAVTGYGFGESVGTAGLLLLPMAGGSVLSQRLMRLLAPRVDVAYIMGGGALLLATALGMLAFAHGDLVEIVVATTIFGICIGCTFAVAPLLIIDAVPPERTGSATSLNQVARAVGGAIGSAASVTVLAAYQPAGAAYPTNGGYSLAFGLGALVCAGAAVVALVALPPGVRSHAANVPQRSTRASVRPASRPRRMLRRNVATEEG
jgi:predicted MFS family arabinose efflux permease